MDLEQIKENRTKMIFQFSIPAIISMLLTSLVTIADGFFIGNYVGKEGIAVASLISALVSLFGILWYFWKKAKVYRLGRFHFSWETCVRSLLNGSSEFIGEMSTGIAMFAYNFVIMRKFGSDGVTAFTIVGYVAYVFSMIVVGFGQGVSPLISFSYGAEEKRLAADLRKRTNRYVFGAGVFVFLVMASVSRWYSSVFVQNENVEKMVQSGMLIFMVSFFFSGVNAITSFYFTATGRALESAGVYLAAPVTEFVTLLTRYRK